MLQPTPRSHLRRSDAPLHGAAAFPLLLDILAPVLVDDAGEFSFAGAIRHREALAVWTWLARDLAPDLLAPLGGDDAGRQALAAALPALIARARDVHASVPRGSEAERRQQAQIGGPELWDRVPVVLAALKAGPLLLKATAFGRAVNGTPDEEAVAAALQAMPRGDAAISALLMVAAVGQVASPGRLVGPAIGIAGAPTPQALVRAGFSPLIEAIMAQAQNTIPVMLHTGPFADIDLVCRAVERFHRLLRAINVYIELDRPSAWASTLGGLTRTVSAALEPRLTGLAAEIDRALRPVAVGADRLDADGLLAALNGVYLLATVRECRDSLALNELLDDAWHRIGQVLELHVDRNMEALRARPDDAIIGGRLETGIKMAALRFGGDYADVLRQVRDGIGRRFAGVPTA